MTSIEYDNQFGKYRHYIIPNYNLYNSKPIQAENEISNFLDINEFPNLIKHMDYSFLGFSPDSRQNLYWNSKCNKHHWTSQFVFDNVIPVIAKNLNINFDVNDFYKINFIDNGFDVSYHDMKDYNYRFNVIDLYNNQLFIGKHEDVVRTTKHIVEQGYYHSLLIKCHQCIRIINENPNLSRKLLINTDSMAIPIVPILAYYFKEIMVLDNRTKNNIYWKIKDFKFTDYICLLINCNYKNKKFLNNMR